MRAPPHASRISRSATVFLATLAGAAGCGPSGQSGTDDAGTTADGAPLVCTITAPTACPDPVPRWTEVSPIFQNRCVRCHNGAVGGPWPLMQYQHAVDWFDVIRSMLLDCTMPPPEAMIPMPDEERTAILTWILCGLPE
jgi:hypothetical protein